MLHANDTTIPSGRVGLGSFDDTGEFRALVGFRGVEMNRLVIAAALLVVTLPISAAAEVTRFEVRSTRVVSDGRSFGAAGPYEEVTGTLYFSVDPADPANRLVVDLDKAVKNGSWQSRVLRRCRDLSSARPGAGQRHRAHRRRESRQQDSDQRIQPARISADREAGDGLVFARGYTVVCIGWEFDVPRRAGAIRLEAPVAAGVRGVVRAMFTPVGGRHEFTVSDLSDLRADGSGSK